MLETLLIVNLLAVAGLPVQTASADESHVNQAASDVLVVAQSENADDNAQSGGTQKAAEEEPDC